MIMIFPLLSFFFSFFPSFFAIVCMCFDDAIESFSSKWSEKKRWMHFELLQVRCARCPLLLLCFSSPAPDCSWCLRCRFSPFFSHLVFIQGGFWITDFQEIPFLHQSQCYHQTKSCQMLAWWWDTAACSRWTHVTKADPWRFHSCIRILAIIWQKSCQALTWWWGTAACSSWNGTAFRKDCWRNVDTVALHNADRSGGKKHLPFLFYMHSCGLANQFVSWNVSVPRSYLGAALWHPGTIQTLAGKDVWHTSPVQTLAGKAVVWHPSHVWGTGG